MSCYRVVVTSFFACTLFVVCMTTAWGGGFLVSDAQVELGCDKPQIASSATQWPVTFTIQVTGGFEDQIDGTAGLVRASDWTTGPDGQLMGPPVGNIEWEQADYFALDEARFGLTTSTELNTNGAYSASSGILPLTAGTYEYAAYIRQAGRLVWSNVVVVTVLESTQSPTIQITSPTEGTIVPEGANLPITMAITDQNGTLDQVVVNKDEAYLDSTVTAPYTVTWESVTSGVHTLTAELWNALGEHAISEPIHVTVQPPYAPPQALADTADSTVGVPTTCAVLTNDLSSMGTTLTITAVTQGAHGTVQLNQDQTITYTPTPEYVGTDVFTYTVADGQGGTDTGTVTITIAIPTTDQLLAREDTAMTLLGQSVIIPVVQNDSTDTETLQVTAVGAGQYGTVVLNPDDTVSYTPETWYIGDDTFTYTLSNGEGGQSIGTVRVTVIEPTYVTAGDDAAETGPDQPVTIAVLANDYCLEGTLTIIDVMQGARGAVTLNQDMSLTYTPMTGTLGEDTFTYTIADDMDHIATATVTVAVNAPPQIQAVDDTAETKVDTGVTIAVLANDSCVAGTLTVEEVTQGISGHVVMNPDGTLTYTPTGYLGADTFTYTICDGLGHRASARVSVEVTLPNIAPYAEDQDLHIDAATLTSITLVASDVNADPLTYRIISQPSHGTLTGTAPLLTYTPTPGYVGDDSFTFCANDGLLESNVATVSLTLVCGDAYEVDNTPAQATPIHDSDPQTHSIHVPGDMDWMVFTLTTASAVTIETNGTSGVLELSLYGPENATTLAPAPNQDCGDANRWPKIAHSLDDLLPAGTYYLRCTEQGNDGLIRDYQVTLHIMNGEGLLGELRADQSLPGSLTAGSTGTTASGIADPVTAIPIQSERGASSSDTTFDSLSASPQAVTITAGGSNDEYPLDNVLPPYADVAPQFGNVDLITGNLSHSSGADLVAYNPRGINASFARSFSSFWSRKDYGSPGLPKGWVHEYDTLIKVLSGYPDWTSTFYLVHTNGSYEPLYAELSAGNPTGKFKAPYATPYAVTGVKSAVAGRWQSITVTFPGGVQWEFTPFGTENNLYVLTRILNNRTSRWITLAWSTSRQLLAVRDDLGKDLLTLKYANNYLSQVTDRNGRMVKYEIGPSTEISYPCLNSVSQILSTTATSTPTQEEYQYSDYYGQPRLEKISVPNPQNNGTKSTWAVGRYSAWRVMSTIDPNNNTREYTYYDGYTKVSIYDPGTMPGTNGPEVSRWTYWHDPQNRLTTINDGIGGTVSYTYGFDTTGILAIDRHPYLPSTVIKDGHMTAYTYDKFGNVLTVTAHADD